MEQRRIVLHVVGRMNMGGAESRIMDLYRTIDREKLQFYFVQHTKERCFFEEEIEKLGGKVFFVPRFNVKNYFAYKKAWEDFFKEHPEIQVVQGHMTSTAAIYLPIAKKAGVEITIAHARSAGVEKGLKGQLTKLLRKDLYKKCDYRFTCSRLAGEAVFGDQSRPCRRAVLIPNAIKVDRFKFDVKTREQLRFELGIEDSYVIGHVGRFSPVKNHKYLLEILEQCIEIERENSLPQTLLLLLGEGELKEEIMEMAVSMGISQRVLFLGNRQEVYKYYQAMDYFLLPSFYEGLPGTAIEAQAAGVPGILSDTITEEAVITDLLQRRSIKEAPKIWAGEIMKKSGKSEEREAYAQKVKEASFDVKEQSVKMQQFYLSGVLE